MTKKLATLATLLLALATNVHGHRLDEYLQATIISVERDRVHASMRLIPGVAVFPAVFASIDTNGDGFISEVEQRSYAERVIRELSLMIDGKRLEPTLVSVRFPEVEQLKEGLGEIQIEFTAELPGGGGVRKVILENHHQNGISAYLVNCLVPQDPNIRILAQNRNESQSVYLLDYEQTEKRSRFGFLKSWSTMVAQMDLVGFASVFRLGMRHIGEGTDHLLFLLTLLVPAPLFVTGSCWAGVADVRQSVLRILKVVTAFTFAHSITLALATLGLVHVPSRPVEVLIAISILVSAIHAARALFPGKEPLIAAFFGLIHGLAFATTLNQLGLGRWERVSGLLAFNLGIETMQLVVVAAVLPSLILLSRTRGYSVLRIGGAVFACLASAGWIAERLLNVPNYHDPIVDVVPHHAIGIGSGLFAVSLVCWWLSRPAAQISNAAGRKRRILPLNGKAWFEIQYVPIGLPADEK
jgi:hypothetical protein